MSEEDIQTFPVTAVNIRHVKSLGALLLQLSFLSRAGQKMEEADPGRNYMLSVEQAQNLRDALDRSIREVKKSWPPKVEGPTN
jgi:hypothetical protein